MAGHSALLQGGLLTGHHGCSGPPHPCSVSNSKGTGLPVHRAPSQCTTHKLHSPAPTGAGKIKLRDNASLYGSDAEHKLRVPEDIFYKKYAAECSKQQISINVFAFPRWGSTGAKLPWCDTATALPAAGALFCQGARRYCLVLRWYCSSTACSQSDLHLDHRLVQQLQSRTHCCQAFCSQAGPK